MPIQRATPGVERALRYIETLRHANPGSGQRLPTLSALARAAGVSVHTMHTAVRQLADAGVLSARQRDGIRWDDPSKMVPLPRRRAIPAVRRGRAERLADEIEAAVLAGALPDPLPSIKELRAHHRAGHQAVRGALTVLADRGIIVRRGRTWVLARAESRKGTSKIMLVAPSPDLALFATFGAKAAEFCAVLERECTLRGIALQFRSSFHPIVPDPSLLGYLVVASHDPGSGAEIVTNLRTGGRPVVVVDVVGDCPMPGLPDSRAVPVVRIQGARSAARQVALRLRELGHRRVAYLSPYKPGTASWVGDRMDGLRDVFGDDVVELWCEKLSSPEKTHSWVVHQLLPRVEPATSSLAADIGTRTGIDEPNWLGAQLIPAITAQLTESRLKPLLDRAAADRSITAWVGANDDAALCALRYLARRRIDVPGTISIVGFDGTRDGLLARLSSFDFNTPAFVKTALELVLHPRNRRAAGTPMAIDIAGVLLMRETVRRA